METRTRRYRAGGRRDGVSRQVSRYVWGENWAPYPLSPWPLAYLPNEAITLGGRWCLVWRGGKGHCDRGLAAPTASSLHLSHLAVSCSVLTYLLFGTPPCTPFSSLFPSPLPSLSPSVCFWGSQSLQPPLYLGSPWTAAAPLSSVAPTGLPRPPSPVLKPAEPRPPLPLGNLWRGNETTFLGCRVRCSEFS